MKYKKVSKFLDVENVHAPACHLEIPVKNENDLQKQKGDKNNSTKEVQKESKNTNLIENTDKN